MKKYIVCLLIIGMLFSLSACSSGEEEIQATLTDFVRACQDLDVKAMLKCIDPAIARPVSNGLSLVGLFTDIDSENLIEDVFDLLFDKDVDPSEFLSGIQFSNLKIEQDGDEAIVKCILTAEISGEQLEYKTEIDMIQEEDHWYISNVRFP